MGHHAKQRRKSVPADPVVAILYQSKKKFDEKFPNGKPISIRAAQSDFEDDVVNGKISTSTAQRFLSDDNGGAFDLFCQKIEVDFQLDREKEIRANEHEGIAIGNRNTRIETAMGVAACMMVVSAFFSPYVGVVFNPEIQSSGNVTRKWASYVFSQVMTQGTKGKREAVAYQGNPRAYLFQDIARLPSAAKAACPMPSDRGARRCLAFGRA